MSRSKIGNRKAWALEIRGDDENCLINSALKLENIIVVIARRKSFNLRKSAAIKFIKHFETKKLKPKIKTMSLKVQKIWK